MISTLVELLGNFYSSSDWSNVEAIARSIGSVAPGDIVSPLFLGLACYRTGRIADALTAFEQARRRNRDAARPDDSKSVGPANDAAAVCYQEATRPDSELAEAWVDLGEVLLGIDRYEQAACAYRSAIRARPDNPRALAGLGRAAWRSGDLWLAERAFVKLRDLQPNDETPYLNLGLIYRRRRDRATARACLVRVRLLRGKPVRGGRARAPNTALRG